MTKPGNEFANGWPVLLAAFVGNALSSGTLAIHTLGILGPALGKEFAWSAGIVSAGILVHTSATLLFSPLAGALVDRVGARPVALASTLLLSLTFLSFALLPRSVPLYFILWAAAAILGAGTYPMTWSRALNGRFHANIGLALGISLIGTGLAGALLKPFEFWLVDLGGWRLGYLGLGCLPLISFGVAFFFLSDSPRATFVRPGDTPSGNPASVVGTTLAQGLRGRHLWLLIAAVALAAAGVGGSVPNLESILRSLALSEAEVRSIVPITGIAIIVGRLFSSYLIDRIWAPGVATVMLGTAAFGFVVLGQATLSFWMVALVIALIGLTVGMEADMGAFLVARYFGPSHFGRIYGLIYGFFAIGTGLGAVSYGVAFDRMGNYRLALTSSAAILSLSGVLMLMLGRYLYPKGAVVALSPQAPVAEVEAAAISEPRRVDA
jgi:predicted MFS family arabinose efflux permease